MALEMSKLRNMTLEELGKEESELREGIWKLKLQMSTGQLQDPYRVRTARRDLARVMTAVRERELTAERGTQ